MPRIPLRFLAPALLAAAALILGPPASRAGQGDYSIRFASGAAIPVGSFGTDWKSGVPIGLTISYGSGKHTDVALDMSYRRLKPAIPSSELFGVKDDNVHLGEWRIGARVRRELAGAGATLDPYVVAGVAMYPVRLVSEDSLGVLEVTSAKLGLNGGVGLDVRVSPEVALGLEGLYNGGQAAAKKIGYDFVPDVEVTLGLRWVPGGGSSED
ncbi:MAG TPA: hypothetical protein VF363_03345 [Candidatus Eisenbacteria bacterium]